MKIIEIRGDDIYCYTDETFCIFSKNALITGADYVGHSWAIGKVCATKRGGPYSPEPRFIKKDTCYHNMIIMVLIEAQAKALTEHLEKQL